MRTLHTMFAPRDRFTSFEKLDDGLVQMGNNSTCNMDGLGKILVNMFDRMVGELKDVRYVPQMKKNLISIGVLEAQGLEFSGKVRFSRCSKVIWLY